ncbi:HAD family hydrolase [Burkholderia sp. D-99]|uniref:HAD family hydrolase n=1 Tax=Burkholderia sp. D-99 TaxID=2717316 RepID=UPI0014225D46|nr:HAD hydrolase-like protein [Burkholderia sp. D-99]NHV27414.1 HAD family hydrolase [Burkholderia sp. D-99]
MKPHRPLVALDFDGTLVSCKEKQLYALDEASKLHHVAYDAFDTFWNLKRNGSSTLKALTVTGVDEVPASKIAATWIDIVESEQASEHDRLLPDVADALRGLATSADLMLLSARRNAALLERQLVSLDLLKFFPIWETVSPLGGVGNSKAQRLVHHGACCYVGDTESDWSASVAAALPFYLLSTGQRSNSFFETHFRDLENAPPVIYGNFQHVADAIKHDLLS